MAKTTVPSQYIADNAVTTAKIAANAITAAQIAGGAIVSVDLGDNSITVASIAGNAVGSSEIAANAVGNSEIAANAVDSAEIVSGSIDTAHLSADAVDGTKIADDSIDSEHYVDGSIDTAHIGDSQVTNAKLANSSVTVNSNSLSLGGTLTLDTDDIGEGSTNLYYTDARAQSAISAGTGITVSSGEISIAGNAITATMIAANAVGSSEIAANSVDSAEIAANAVSTSELASTAAPTFASITTTGNGDIGGNLTVTGNLQVDGTTTTINSTNLSVDDLNITVAAGAANAAAANGAGLTVDGANATITYDSTNDWWDYNKGIRLDGEGLKLSFRTSSASSKGEIYTGDTFGSNRLIIAGENGIHNVIDGNANGVGDWSVYNDNTSTHLLYVTGSNGRVGIGTSSPSHTLSIGGTTSGKKLTMYLAGTDENYSAVGAQRGESNLFCSSEIRFINESNSAGTSAISFATGDNTMSEAMRIDSSGNIGIGTSVPTDLLEINSQLSAASTVDYPLVISSRDDANSINQLGGEGVGIKFRLAGNSTATPGDSIVGASIAAMRESSSDAVSDTGLGFFISQDDETLDEALRINHDGNVGIGCLPDAWSGYSVLQLGNGGALAASADVTFLSANGYSSSTGWRYATTDEATLYQQQGGEHIWLEAASGSADSLITWSESMRLNTSGFLGIGTSNPLDLLYINSDSTDARVVIDGHTDYDAELKFAENGTVKYTIGHDAATDSFVIGTTNVDTNKRLEINSSGGVKLYQSLEIVNSSAAEITLSGAASGGNLVSQDTLYLLAGSGTNSGALYLGSNGTNAQVQLVGGQLGVGTSPNAKLHVSTTSSKILELQRNTNIYDLTISDVGEGVAQLWFNAQTTNTGFNFRPKDSSGTNNNALFIAPNGDVAIGGTGLSLTNGSIGPSLKIQSDNRGTDVALILEADSGEFALYSYNNKFEVLETKTSGTVSYLTTLQHDGKYGINTRSPYGRLDVNGALTLTNGDNDFGTHTYSAYASVVSHGEIQFTAGYSGTLTASRNFVFTYQATSWKAWGCEIEMASTEGLACWKVGGYNNNSGGHNSYENNDQNGMASLTYSRNGQQNIITLGFDRQHIHPCFKVKYWQSGGDGAPRMDRVKVEIT